MKAKLYLSAALAAAGALYASGAYAGVSADEAAKLKTTLMPLGGEKAGSADGSIPAWTGGMVDPNYHQSGGRRDDLFVGDKPLFSITAANMAQYADKLTEGTKAMFAKYSDYRIDVYTTVRSAAAPQWVYDNTYKNATSGKLVDGSSGPMPVNVYGGIPFPIPAQGIEVLWNHLLTWRGTSWKFDINSYLVTADGRRVMTVDGQADQQMPYYFKDGSAESWNGVYWMIRLMNAGPPIRAGEGIVGRQNVNFDKTEAWVYLTGQRRTRKLPNPCCDTPTPSTAGLMGFDEINLFQGRPDRFDWTLVGKKEIYIPYNTNQAYTGSDADVVGAHFINPDKLRWELHRVWVVDAALKPGQRHVAPKSRYYFDEDSWWGVLAERYDGNNALWHFLYQWTFPMPDLPGIHAMTFGYNEMLSGAQFISGLLNEKSQHITLTPPFPDSNFTAEAMMGENIR